MSSISRGKLVRKPEGVLTEQEQIEDSLPRSPTNGPAQNRTADLSTSRICFATKPLGHSV